MRGRECLSPLVHMNDPPRFYFWFLLFPCVERVLGVFRFSHCKGHEEPAFVSVRFIHPNFVVKSCHICPSVDTEDFLFSSLLLFFRWFPLVCCLQRRHTEAGWRGCGFSLGLKGLSWPRPTLLPNNRLASPPRPQVTSSSTAATTAAATARVCSWAEGRVGQ